jgi:hypothetical protein
MSVNPWQSLQMPVNPDNLSNSLSILAIFPILYKFLQSLQMSAILAIFPILCQSQAVHSVTNERYAIKVISKKSLFDRNEGARFERDVTALPSVDSADCLNP